jgi:hypothetical protein
LEEGELGEVEEVAQILGSDRLMPDGPPLAMREAMVGEGEESGDEVREDTWNHKIQNIISHRL